eukprot:TRINITY_DN7285_c0_g1_i1.p1 TRINITY_DN7285_c0_g1~~TRINITY_DN7285_c0_g1_i1.p1  ORF type:complete len:355 (-),score=58.66 TRINITY_DN7285_c0_g1_i1:95-1159(-)
MRQLTQSMSNNYLKIYYTGSQDFGKVYAFGHRKGSVKAEFVYTIATDLNTPSGVAWKNGDLYVSVVGAILKFPGIDAKITRCVETNATTCKQPNNIKIDTNLHYTNKNQYIKFSPKAPEQLYIFSDNKILRTNITQNQSKWEEVVTGVEYCRGFDWRNTNELWFTDYNGAEGVGNDNIPFDELNQYIEGQNRTFFINGTLREKSNNYGAPYCFGKNNLMPNTRSSNMSYYVYNDTAGYWSCNPELFIESRVSIQAHSSVSGMIFLRSEGMFSQFGGKALIVEAGDENRIVPVGWQIVMVDVNQPKNVNVFASGWKEGGKGCDNLVDIIQIDDGSLLVSASNRGVVYRISTVKSS